MDTPAKPELIAVLDTFCSGFANRDTEAVLSVFDLDADLVVITSDEWLLRGAPELQHFLARYVEGGTTYSWKWERHDVSRSGPIAWLLAEGTETAETDGRSQQHPYRMTMVLERRKNRWVLRQVHGSSPH
jgi:ketosteroid isomerase-like protein